MLTVNLHYFVITTPIIIIIIIIICPLIFLSIFIPHPLQSQSTLYNHYYIQPPLRPIPYCQWLVDGCPTAVDEVCQCGKIKFFTHSQRFHSSYMIWQTAWDIWHPKLNSVGHWDCTPQPTNGSPVLKAHTIHVLC